MSPGEVGGCGSNEGSGTRTPGSSDGLLESDGAGTTTTADGAGRPRRGLAVSLAEEPDPREDREHDHRCHERECDRDPEPIARAGSDSLEGRVGGRTV